MSPFVRITDSSRTSRHVRFVQIVLQKSFLAGDGNFLEPLMRFARGDVRVHIGSHKNDHGPLYPSYRALQRRRRLKIDLREIFGVARFSTFATLSAMNGHLRGATAGASNRTTGAPLGDPASAAIEWRVAASRCPLVGLSQLGCIEGPTDVPTTVRAIHKRKGYSFRSLQGSLRPHRDSGGRHAADFGLAQHTWPGAIRAALCRERH